MAALRVIVAGAEIPGSRTVQRIRAMRALGHRVAVVGTAPPGRTYEDRPSLGERLRHRLRLPADPAGANRALVAAAMRGCDLVWIENAAMIRRASLLQVRRRAPGARLVWYAEDDMMSPRHRSRWTERCLPLFDLWVTTKSFNARPDEMPALGVRRVLFVDNGFDPDIHRPVAVTAADRARFGAAVAFVGTFEAARAEAMVFLARNGIGVRIWGNGWRRMRGAHPLLRIENRPLYDDDYARALCASDINLCFLRKANRDLQTTRSIEIPACGAFMLHERNAEIAALFAEDREAAYFASPEELVAACRRWLADEAGRRAVAAAGRRRVVAAGLRHHDIVQRVFAAALRPTETEPVA